MAWSFRVASKPIISQPATHRMRGPASGVKEFTEHELHAQAAQVLGHAQAALSPLEYLYCEVKWGRRNEWTLLSDYLLQKTSIERRRRRGIDKIVRRWRGERIGVRAMQWDLHCRHADVERYRRDVFGCLQQIHDKVIDRLEHALDNVIDHSNRAAIASQSS